MVKLLPCDLEVMGLSCENSLLQYRVKPQTIDPFLGSRIGGNFVHRAAI